MKKTMKPNAVHLQTALEQMKEYPTAREGLAAMAEATLSPGESHAIADEIIAHLTKYEMPAKAPHPAICDALNTFYLQELLPREAEIRVGILRRMAFALEIFSDESLLQAFDAADSFSDLYGSLFPEDHEDSLAEEIRQRDRLLAAITRLNLSPASMKYLAKQLAENEFYISNTLALGLDTFLLRSATALHLCLSGHSPEEAVSHAVQNTQTELYPLGPIEKGISAAIVILGILATLLLTEVFIGYYDLPLFLAETFGILSGLLLYQELVSRQDGLRRGLLSLLIRWRSLSPKETA